MTMLRPVLRSSTLRTLAGPLTKAKSSSYRVAAGKCARCTFATQSGDATPRPTALAKLHLEDGTTLTGTSFGSHESVEGEVRI